MEMPRSNTKAPLVVQTGGGVEKKTNSFGGESDSVVKPIRFWGRVVPPGGGGVRQELVWKVQGGEAEHPPDSGGSGGGQTQRKAYGRHCTRKGVYVARIRAYSHYEKTVVGGGGSTHLICTKGVGGKGETTF